MTPDPLSEPREARGVPAPVLPTDEDAAAARAERRAEDPTYDDQTHFVQQARLVARLAEIGAHSKRLRGRDAARAAERVAAPVFGTEAQETQLRNLGYSTEAIRDIFAAGPDVYDTAQAGYVDLDALDAARIATAIQEESR